MTAPSEDFKISSEFILILKFLSFSVWLFSKINLLNKYASEKQGKRWVEFISSKGFWNSSFSSLSKYLLPKKLSFLLSDFIDLIVSIRYKAFSVKFGFIFFFSEENFLI